MSKVKFVLNRQGVRELLKSSEMAGVVSQATSQILDAANSELPEFSSEITTRSTRVVGIVKADTVHANFHAREHNTLEKAKGRAKV